MDNMSVLYLSCVLNEKNMKIKTEYYGVFYKDGDSWRGPVYGDTYTHKNAKKFSINEAKRKKKKTKIFQQVWKSV